MRDPNRIPVILERLAAIWKANPDLRLGQILVLAARAVANVKTNSDVFIFEDDRMLAGLDRLAEAFTSMSDTPP